jgi:hypothetical protein
MVPSSGETITYVTELCHSESTGLLKVSIEFKKLQTEKTAIDDLITATTTEMEQIDIELAVAVVAGEKANATTIRARAKEAKARRTALKARLSACRKLIEDCGLKGVWSLFCGDPEKNMADAGLCEDDWAALAELLHLRHFQRHWICPGPPRGV